MKKTVVTLPGKRKYSIPASPAIIAEGKFMFVSGQGPFDPAVGDFVRGTVGEQTRLTMERIKIIVEAGGATMDDVVSCRIFLRDLTAFAEMNAAYEKFFGDEKPARTTVGCQLLYDIAVEIECIARLP